MAYSLLREFQQGERFKVATHTPVIRNIFFFSLLSFIHFFKRPNQGLKIYSTAESKQNNNNNMAHVCHKLVFIPKNF